MTINDRIKQIRKKHKLSQAEFGNIIGLKNGAVCVLEKPGRSVVEQNIILICDRFHVSRQWLESGTGDMNTASADPQKFLSPGQKQESTSTSASFQEKLSYMMTKLNQEDWDKLEEIFHKMTKDEKRDK